MLFFFFQAEDGIRDSPVTGVQTCALPISMAITAAVFLVIHNGIILGLPKMAKVLGLGGVAAIIVITFAVTVWAINNKRRLLSLMFSSVVLILIGYSSYVTIFIRSNQDPRIDENDPETITRAISYIDRKSTRLNSSHW